MKIIVKNLKIENNIIIVVAKTKIGYVRGVWKSETIPQIGKKYFVETTIGEFSRQISPLYEKYVCSNTKVKNSEILMSPRQQHLLFWKK